MLAMIGGPVSAAQFAAAQGQLNIPPPLEFVSVFSDDPRIIHDPRHPQSQTGANKMFAPIGLISTNRRQPNQGERAGASFHMGTAFLVSPCYVMTAYHVVFGGQQIRPSADKDYAATFRAGGKQARAVPVVYGEFFLSRGKDWVLLQLDADTQGRCLGEDVGWLRLAPQASTQMRAKTLSVAGYPADKSIRSLWRQDRCRVYEELVEASDEGTWTTDCATRSRASGSPVFFVKGRVLNVVAVMSRHLAGDENEEILPKWDPTRANLAIDVRKITSSNPDFLRLIRDDIDRFHKSNPAAQR